MILSPVVQLATELERQFVAIEHELPGRDQLTQLVRAIANELGELPEGDDFTALLDSASGLTRVEVQNAFSLSLNRHGSITPDVLWEIKARTLKRSGLLTIPRAAGALPIWGTY